MIKMLIGALLLVAGALQGPSVDWKSEVKKTGDHWQLVLTGQVEDGYYTHPMDAKYVGTTIELEASEAVSALGDPVEEFEPSDYKGEREICHPPGPCHIRNRKG